LLGIDQENTKIPFYRLASGLEKLMLSSSQEINVDKEDLEILQFIQVEARFQPLLRPFLTFLVLDGLPLPPTRQAYLENFIIFCQ
jgi:hypothetical protein